MRKKLLIALGVIVGIVLVFVIIVAMQPSHYRVQRSTTVLAPASAAYEHVIDFQKWAAWSPWEKVDPSMKRTYGGSASGVGATYEWVGNSDVGEGKMTIIKAEPNQLVRVKLEFHKPMEGVSEATFAFKPDGDRTAVTWSMEGENNFIGKAFCLFMNMDKMIGEQFEKGLKDLKAVAESKARATAPTTAPASAPATAPASDVTN